MRYRFLCSMIVLIIISSLLVACDGAAPSPTSPPPATSVPIPPPPPPPTTAPSGLAEGTVAVYMAGTWEESRALYALDAAGNATELEQGAYHWPRPVISPSGRWIAAVEGPPKVSAIRVDNLEEATTFTVQATAEFVIDGMAFDATETRLVFVEVGPSAGADTAWAYVVVDLADFSTARFEATLGPNQDPMPGFPIGWAGSGNELIVQAYLPNAGGGLGSILGIALPPGTASVPYGNLGHRELLGAWNYVSTPILSPAGNQLLYVARDPDYTPDNYQYGMFDLAGNQVWTIDLASGTPSRLVQMTDGGGMANMAAWSPDGTEMLFAHGQYDGQTFASLMLKRRDFPGNVFDVAPLPLPPQGNPVYLHWCAPDVALYVASTSDGMRQLYTVNLFSSEASLITSADDIYVLGCVQ